MYMKKNSNKGFSLIELMIVVAIIGILTAVSLPTFKNFQRRARAMEAKTGLAAIWVAQKTFFSEYGNYYTNLEAVGYLPEGQMLYVIGFDSPGGIQPTTLPSSATSDENMNTQLICAVSSNCVTSLGTISAGVDLATYGSFTVNSNGTEFLIGAAGVIGGVVDDVWSMTHAKQMINISNGTL